MIPDSRLSSIVENETALLGYELVKLDVISRGRRKILRLFIDRPDGGVTVEDCVKVSKAVGLVLDGEEAMAGPYNLEVSSPGINRPLVKPGHFARFAGRMARVEYSAGEGGKKSVIGEIARVEDEAVVIVSDGAETAVRLDRILKANLHGEDWDIGGRKSRRKKKTRKSR